ncbi:hypothetical protein CPB84DRAFT_926655 [Gymnopilus junonius]|uniref:Uncharacterized protein n=1 Tax=Gymnopilus junonius TaxID=109634 RepID=A0A9P5NZ65_GYMJU|nr:hypothetical protein CPB84DRAFT_926655 [Gymnopilus junonius]
MLSPLQLASARAALYGCAQSPGFSKALTITSPRLTFRSNTQSKSTRHFYTSTSRRQEESQKSGPDSKSCRHVKEDPYVYQGPLTAAFRRLKIFSLGSFGLATTLSPFILMIQSNLPMNARLALASIALGTSGLSTGLVAWCAKPYVTTMHRFRPDEMGSAEEVELTTYTLTLRPRITKVYDPSFLIETRRPLAKWELADRIALTQNRTDAVGTNVHPAPGQEETVAETRDSKGEIVGRWVVKWEEGGVGICHEVGHIVRYFNVHEELLQ